MEDEWERHVARTGVMRNAVKRSFLQGEGIRRQLARPRLRWGSG
jgi:hypothetical protein